MMLFSFQSLLIGRTFPPLMKLLTIIFSQLLEHMAHVLLWNLLWCQRRCLHTQWMTAMNGWINVPQTFPLCYPACAAWADRVFFCEDWVLQRFQVLHLLYTLADNHLLVRLYVWMCRVWSIGVTARVCAHFRFLFLRLLVSQCAFVAMPVSVCYTACVSFILNIVFLKH